MTDVDAEGPTEDTAVQEAEDQAEDVAGEDDEAPAAEEDGIQND